MLSFVRSFSGSQRNAFKGGRRSSVSEPPEFHWLVAGGNTVRMYASIQQGCLTASRRRLLSAGAVAFGLR